MSTVTEIQAALPKLSRAEIELIREWIDDYLENRLDLTDEVKQKLDKSRAEIAAGHYTTRSSRQSRGPADLWAGKDKYKPGVYILPKKLDEEVARLHLEKTA